MCSKTTRGVDRSSQYAKLLSKIPSLELEEEIELFLRWRDHGDVAARDVLIESSLKVTVAMARRYQARYHDFDELLAAGCEGVMHALNKFDPKFDRKFSAYTWNWIRSYIGKVMIDNWSITGGKGILRSNKLYTLIKARRKIQASTSDRDDVIEKIAIEMNTTPEQVRLWIERVDCRDSSFDYMSEEGRCLYDTMPAPGIDPETSAIDNDRMRYIRGKIAKAMQNLTEREREVITRRIMTDGQEETLQVIGDEKGISRERIRQIEANALKKLRAVIEIDGKRPAINTRVKCSKKRLRKKMSKPSLISSIAA